MENDTVIGSGGSSRKMLGGPKAKGEQKKFKL
jgi:hypothetical protein